MINIADLVDPNDEQGRSYRQVNASRSHAFSIGDLVELENGTRLFVIKQTRDCDMTPLYSLSMELEVHDNEFLNKWSNGHSEESLILIRTKEQRR